MSETQSTKRHHYQTLPMDQVAAELGVTVRDVEGLLVSGELEGIPWGTRWSGVRPASLEAYRNRPTPAPVPVAIPAPTTPAPVETVPDNPLNVERFRILPPWLTAAFRS